MVLYTPIISVVPVIRRIKLGKQGLNSIFNQKTFLMFTVDLIFNAGSVPKTVIIRMELKKM